jgi:hypothetical protein
LIVDVDNVVFAAEPDGEESVALLGSNPLILLLPEPFTSK